MKKVSVLLICLLIVLGCCPAAFAADVDNVLQAPRSSNFTSYSASIGATSNSIICQTRSVLTAPKSQSITMSLQKWNGSTWSTINSWSTSSISLEVNFKKSYPISPGKYRVQGKHSASGEVRYSYSGTQTFH